jgi:quinol monooxygenase YgiN
VITFVAQMKVRPENAAAYEMLLTTVRDQTLANEPGVAWYSFGKSADEPDSYVVIEVYRDAAAHAAHMRTEWVIASIPKSRALVDGQFDIRQFVSPGTEPAMRQLKQD